MSSIEEPGVVPVTLVSGFLGAGKSTLIRRILTEKHGLRIAVVENEFGQTLGIENSIVTQGVDSTLIPEFVELPNGCLCCTVKDDLVDALARLLAAKQIDHIVIEASGAADPAPVAALFWVDEALEMRLALDGIITVVDASAVKTEGKVDRLEFIKQIALADRVLLNKVDRISDTERELMEDFVQRHNPGVRVQACVQCDVPLHDLLRIRAFEMSVNAVRRDLALTSADSHGPQSHSHGLESHVVLVPANWTFQPRALERALGDLLWGCDDDDVEDNGGSDPLLEANDQKQRRQEIWRIKGVVRVAVATPARAGDAEHEREREPPHWWIVQGVDDTFEVCAPAGNASLSTSQPWELLGSRILFIGRHLRRARLDHTLLQASTALPPCTQP
ncbi:COBW domain-containing protein 1 [Porphyridium purpureum]|uniref:COBW domain-containing protein 1 n=1 Tax=Porphyridium purpureum TaxID=35688 RepID=A0A5J4Z1T5_PORPP|nr:COBW domain-containing protein 1 [Porphyridium purpureum]|eukprot:POR0208..scf295_1